LHSPPNVLLQEREALETRSLPMRQYLVDNVLPLLTKGLLEVGRLRPEDPIDFLAEYLFKNDAKAD
jgi:adenylate kinase